MSAVPPPTRPAGRMRDATRTQTEILRAATEEFARQGYAGARADEIGGPHADHEADDPLISSFCFFGAANRHTFGTRFRRGLIPAGTREHYRRMLAGMVVA